MPDLEKVIRGLECCMDSDCFPNTCPYYPEMQNCGEILKRHALELLKAQQPHVLESHELRGALKVPAWKQTKSMHPNLYQGWVLLYEIQKGAGITGERLGMAQPSGRVVWYKIEDYGKTWRIWTMQPTDKQSEETPWEVAHE